MVGVSILLLLFVFIPYYLSLEHLGNLKQQEDLLQSDFDKFNNFNKSLVSYFQNYGLISEPLIDNDFKNISTRINDLLLSGETIYPKCDQFLITKDFLKCNIELMVENEFDYLINNKSESLASSTFKSTTKDWRTNYEPNINKLQDLVHHQYVITVEKPNTITAVLQIPEKLNTITKNYFERDLPKIILSVFLGSHNPDSADTLESTQASLKDLILSFRSNLTKVESDIEETMNLITSITKRIGDVGTPVGSIALGFEEIMVFSPIILAFFYLSFLFLLMDAIKLKKGSIPSGDIVDTISPLIFYSVSSKKLNLILVSVPTFIFCIYSGLMIIIWQKFDPFLIFEPFFMTFFGVYILCGFMILLRLYQVSNFVKSR